MMDLQTIRYMNRQAAQRSAREGKLPIFLDEHDVRDIKDGFDDRAIRKVPFIGDRLPRGFRRVRLGSKEFPLDSTHGVYDGDNKGFGAFFVDSSGFGRDDEPAMSFGQFKHALRSGFYYAMIEQGQFQVKIGVFAKSRARKNVSG